MLKRLLSKSVDWKCEGLFLDSQFCSTGMFLMPQPHWLDHSSFVVNFEIGKCESFIFVPFQDCFVYSGSLAFSYGS